MKKMRNKIILLMQLASMLGIWVLFSGIIWWLANSIWSSVELHDVPNATIAIAVIAMVVFLILVIILTYVFIGLQLGRDARVSNTEGNDG